MPYLTRLTFNPMASSVQYFMQNRQKIHATILNAITIQPVTERILWRLETDSEVTRYKLYILTQSSPNWSNVFSLVGTDTSKKVTCETIEVGDYSILLNRIKNENTFAFKLQANPTHSVIIQHTPSDSLKPASTEVKRRGKRVGHDVIRYQLDWITNKKRLENWGFEFSLDQNGEPRVSVVERSTLRIKKKLNDRNNIVTIASATYSGLLRITDVEKFKACLLNGIGPAKSYGCGLLTLAPI